MNVLILNPPGINNMGFVREGRCEQRLSSFQYVMLPVSLTTTASLLRQEGFSVCIIDAVAEGLDWKPLLERISRFDPRLMILNLSTVTYENDREIAQALKKLFPGTHFSAIGVHVTALPRQVLAESVLDSVIIGEPELISLNLSSALKEGKDLSKVKGLAYRTQDRAIRINPAEAFIEDLDSLPFPARDLVKNELYTLPVVNRPYTLLVPSRGCPYSCIFCTANAYYGKKPRFRSVENVMGELEEIVKKYNIHYATMWSDTFTLNKDFVIRLCGKIIEARLDLKWMCNSRVDTIDDEMLGWMARSGCIGISYGIESGDEEVLKNIKKGITVSQIEKAVRLTNRHGIESLAHVIFGLTGDTPEKIRKTISFIKGLKPSYAQFYCAVPFPGTEFYNQAKEKGWLITEDWSKFEINKAVISTPLLSAKELDRLRKKAYISFFLNPAYIGARLRKIKNLKDFWTNIRQAFNFMKSWVVSKK